MPNITRKFNVTTDASGGYATEQTVNPPGFWSLTVSLSAELLAPSETIINGTLEINAANGSTENSPHDFSARTNEAVDLGSWKLDGGDNSISISGQTEPVRANETLEITVTASL